jgi:hypothetical protein
MSSLTGEATAIRPFQIEVPEEQLSELRRRIEATRWPSKELFCTDLRAAFRSLR